MTALHLQKLDVADCEAALERGYFDWGRGWAKDSPEPDWDEASPQQRRAIALRGYGLYDGLPPQLGNRLGWLEIYASVGINSRVVVYDAVRFLRRSEEAQLLLGRIPDHTALEDGTESQIAAAADLIDLFGRESQIGRSKATKVLY